MQYPPPKLAQGCLCVGEPMKAMFCMTGHMMECHYPLDCRAAVCGHLVKYDWDPQEIAEAQAGRDELFTSLADADCSTCKGTGSKTIESTLQEVYGTEAVMVGPEVDVRLRINTFCECVWQNPFLGGG